MAASDTPIQDALWQLFAAVSSTGVELLDQANLLDSVSASVAGIVLLLGYFSLTEDGREAAFEVYIWVLGQISALTGLSGGPLNWLWTQVALGQILQLEVNHIRDTCRAKREGRTGVDALKGGLAHVNTGAAAMNTTKKKAKGKVKGMGGAMGAPQPV
eukprot:gene19199-17401_t